MSRFRQRYCQGLAGWRLVSGEFHAGVHATHRQVPPGLLVDGGILPGTVGGPVLPRDPTRRSASCSASPGGSDGCGGVAGPPPAEFFFFNFLGPPGAPFLWGGLSWWVRGGFFPAAPGPPSWARGPCLPPHRAPSSNS